MCSSIFYFHLARQNCLALVVITSVTLLYGYLVFHMLSILYIVADSMFLVSQHYKLSLSIFILLT